MTDIERRVENGIVWLTEHDPTGRFHLWFTSKLLPSTPMPAQDEESRLAYREYYAARVTFEKLWKQLEREEAARGG